MKKFINTHVERYDKCKYPGCQGNIVPNRSKVFCNKHQELYEFFMWMLNNVKIKSQEEPKTPGGLYLPK